MRPDNAQAIVGAVLLVVGVVIVVALVIVVCYLLTLQKALSRVSPRNRLMEPGMVWLSLIPCFNIIWQFFIAQRVPDSLRNEFRDRGQDDGSDYGKSIAMTVAVLNVVSSVANAALRTAAPDFGSLFGCVFGLVGLVELVLFVMFWVKIAGYSGNWRRRTIAAKNFCDALKMRKRTV